MCRYLYITTLVLLTPLLAFLSPLPLPIGKATSLTDVERSPVFRCFFYQFLASETGSYDLIPGS